MGVMHLFKKVMGFDARQKVPTKEGRNWQLFGDDNLVIFEHSIKGGGAWLPVTAADLAKQLGRLEQTFAAQGVTTIVDAVEVEPYVALAFWLSKELTVEQLMHAEETEEEMRIRNFPFGRRTLDLVIRETTRFVGFQFHVHDHRGGSDIVSDATASDEPPRDSAI